jgi:hypothetical protein
MRYANRRRARKGRSSMASRLARLAPVIATMVVGALAAGAANGSTSRHAVAPTNSAPPTISGTTTVGQTLTANPGTWTGTAPISYTYDWRQCDAVGGACKDVSNNTNSTFTLVSSNAGNTMRVTVTAKNADGMGTTQSAQTAVIAAATTTTTTTTTTTPVSNGCASNGGTVPIANMSPPAHLNIDAFQVNPSPITYGTRSMTVRVHISGCGGNVQGALVYVTAVPYNMFNVPAEATTGSDGWANLNFTALPGFPVSKKQQLLVMFIRARKNGEDLLAGISARRLISFTVTKS